jgi:integrase
MDLPSKSRFARGASATSEVKTITAEDALRAIETWHDLTERRRRDLRAATRLLGRVTQRPLGTVELRPVAIQALLDATTPAACNLKHSTFIAYRSAIRYVMQRLGVLADRRPSQGAELSAAWAALLAALPTRFDAMRLIAFARFASARGAEPGDVDDALLDAFVEHLRQADIRCTAWERVRRAVGAWNRAINTTVPGWPARRLTAPTPPSRQYSLPFDAYPASLQQDIARFEARLQPAARGSATGAHGGLYAGDGPIVPLRPGAIRTHRVALRLALAALVHSGTPPERITGLSALLTEANRRSILTWHYERAGGRRTDQMAAIGNVMRIIGKYHAPLAGAELQGLLADIKHARPPKQRHMTAKNAGRLRELEDPSRCAALVMLPTRLMAIARRQRDGWVDEQGLDHPAQPKRAAWLASIAVSIEILLHCPLRLSNLAGLRIGTHLQDADGRGKRWTHLVVEPHEVKNGARIEWPLERHTSDLLKLYIDEFRPLVAHPASSWLLPSRDHADRPRDKSTLGTAITDTIHEHVGVRMNPHLFRAFAGALILEDNPHAIDDLRDVLGHQGFETALKHYRAVSAKGAAQRLAGLVSRKRGLRPGTPTNKPARFLASRPRRKS